MRITFGIDVSPEVHRQFHEWWWRNGVLWTQPIGSIRVNTDRRTISFWHLVVDPEPGDIDFPELRRDIENKPLTEERTVALLVDPPRLLWDRRREPQVA